VTSSGVERKAAEARQRERMRVAMAELKTLGEYRGEMEQRWAKWYKAQQHVKNGAYSQGTIDYFKQQFEDSVLEYAQAIRRARRAEQSRKQSREERANGVSNQVPKVG